jgi:hypothetical protein
MLFAGKWWFLNFPASLAGKVKVIGGLKAFYFSPGE